MTINVKNHWANWDAFLFYFLLQEVFDNNSGEDGVLFYIFIFAINFLI